MPREIEEEIFRMENKAGLQEHRDGGDGGCSDRVRMEAADLQDHHDGGAAVLESRWRLCRQVMVETVLERCWETLEVSRMIKEVEDGGVERMEKVETHLRGLREDGEAMMEILAEEEARSRRMEKTERLKNA